MTPVSATPLKVVNVGKSNRQPETKGASPRQKPFQRREPTPQQANLQVVQELQYIKKQSAERLVALQNQEAISFRLVSALEALAVPQAVIQKLIANEPIVESDVGGEQFKVLISNHVEG